MPRTHGQCKRQSEIIDVVCRALAEELLGKLPQAESQTHRIRLQLFQVFKTSGVPTVTFVEPEHFYLLKLALAQPGKGVVIEGPSGIGKTTALRKALETLTSTSEAAKTLILSARRPEDVHKIETVRKWHTGFVGIDDFHRLSAEVRKDLTDYIKYLADNELDNRKLVVVGIPGTGKRLVDIAFDVATRIAHFKFGRVRDEIILNMISKGQAALNIAFDCKTDIARAASGSLNVAQILCAHIAPHEGIEITRAVGGPLRVNLRQGFLK